jgi:hypothetical protein
MKKHIKKNFIAVLMSGETDEFWFETEEEAWEYIYSRSCEDCKKDRKFDACSAEWDVWTKEEYDKYTQTP